MISARSGAPRSEPAGDSDRADDARAAILANVRSALASARRELARHGLAEPARPNVPSPGAPRGVATAAERKARFAAMLEAADGRVHRVADEAQALEALRAIARAAGVERVAVSDDPRATRLAAALAAGAPPCGPDAPREELLACALGLTGAQAGIAETGTLVLDAAVERHRVAALLPPIHVALLDAERIQGTLGDALEALRAAGGGQISPAVTFVTGPSRTADIELTLVVGVHGPKAMHVLLFDPPRSD